MSRYIDADEYIAYLHKALDNALAQEGVTSQGRLKTIAIVASIEADLRNEDITPTINIQERKVGKWLETEAFPHRIYCSECYKTYIPNKYWCEWQEGIMPRNYCPNCGAKMENE